MNSFPFQNTNTFYAFLTEPGIKCLLSLLIFQINLLWARFSASERIVSISCFIMFKCSCVLGRVNYTSAQRCRLLKTVKVRNIPMCSLILELLKGVSTQIKIQICRTKALRLAASSSYFYHYLTNMTTSFLTFLTKSFEQTLLHKCQFTSESNCVKFPAILWAILCVGNTGYLLKLLQKSQQIIIKKRVRKKSRG